MSKRCALALLALGCSANAPKPEPVANKASMTSSSASARHVIRGVVRDYNKHVVAGAHVSASFDGQYVETRTDARGAFSVEAPRGAFVSATAGDMLGHVTVDGDTIEIVMTQLPM